jgi:hypothetical protein
VDEQRLTAERGNRFVHQRVGLDEVERLIGQRLRIVDTRLQNKKLY